MSNANDKLKHKKLREKRDGLQDKASHMRRKVEELKADIEHTKRDISSRDEQIERKTDQLMSQLQKIKAIDDEKARLIRLLEQSQIQRGSVNPKDKLQALMLAVSRMSQDGSQTSGESAIMNDLADMARTSQRLMTRVKAVVPDGGNGSNIGGGTGKNKNENGGGELNKVKVWYNKTSCTFKVTDLHTFRDLLDEVIQYWSLQPAKNVLVNAQNFIWPLNASVREVIGALPEGKDDPGAVIKVWNRDNRDKVTFDQWIMREDKIQKEREETEQMKQMQIAILGDSASKKETNNTFGEVSNGGGNSSGGGGGSSGGGSGNGGGSKAPDLGPGASRRQNDGFPESATTHEIGMDVTKLADQQDRTDTKRARRKVSGHGAINFCKYVDLFLFLLFITLFGNTLFMRRSVYRAGLVRSGVVDVLFGDSQVISTPARSQVLYQGLEVGTQSVANGNSGSTETLSFQNIASGAQIWQWLEGPFRSVVTGMMNGTASIGVAVNNGNTNNDNVGKTFLRHNVLVGRPRIAQWRVKEDPNDNSCVKPERLDLFMHPCLSHYQVGINQDKGIEIGSIVRYSDQDEARNVVEAIDTSTYRSPVYTLKDTIDGTTRTNVQRSEIGTSTWKSIAQLTNQQRTTVWNNTDGFTFDHEEENKYSKGLLQYIPAMTGVVSNALYGGGFASDVPSTLIEFDEHMSTLKRNVWIDDKTRAIEISFNMYNANYDFLIVTTASFDLTPGGGTNPRKTVKVVRLCDNWKAEDLTRIQLEWVCLGLMILGYVSVLLSACSKFMQVPNEKDAKLLNFYDTNAIKNKQSKVRRGRDQKKTNQACTEVFLGCPTRCSRCCGELVSFWNAIEFILLGALVTDLILRNNYQNVITKYSPTELFGDRYVDLSWPVTSYQTSINLSSLVMFLSVTKCFKYFQLNPAVSLAWRVLARSAQTFISFMFIFIIFMMSFTLTGYVIFGPHSSDFYSMQKTGVQLFRMVIGGFEYQKLAQSNPWIAPIYFVSVAIIGFFVLRNLFIAIINDEFGKVARDVRENGFHWLSQVNPEDRPVHQITSKGNKNVRKKNLNHFPGNKIS